MAFQSSNAQPTNNQNQGQNTNWKASGFLNLYLPTKDGKRMKLGAIPLKESRDSEKKMLDWLNEDPSRVNTILSKLEIEYRSAVPTEGSGFDLG